MKSLKYSHSRNCLGLKKTIEKVSNEKVSQKVEAKPTHSPVTPEVIELTAKTISRVRGTEEAKEGFDAFLNKRPANWIPKP
jgi:hypothetical protein